MAGRPLSAVSTIFASQGSGTLNNIPQLDADFAQVLSFYNDSAIGYANYFADTGSANNYVVTLPAAPSAYIAGMTMAVKIGNTNTAASVINANSLGNVAIVNPANIALIGGELSANAVYPMVYDGTSFRIIGPCALFKTLSASTNQTIECAGYSSVSVQVNWTSGANLNVTLSHVGAGVPCFVTMTNTVGANLAVALLATTPAGVSYTNGIISLGTTYNAGSNLLTPAAGKNFQTGDAVNLSTGFRYMFTGAGDGGTFFYWKGPTG